MFSINCKAITGDCLDNDRYNDATDYVDSKLKVDMDVKAALRRGNCKCRQGPYET